MNIINFENSMKDIAIFGAGGFGREVACLINRINEKSPNTWNFIGFFDDDNEIWGTKNEYGKVLGGMDALNQWDKPLSIVVSIGKPQTVKTIVGKIVNPLIDFPNVLAPDTILMDPDSFHYGRGNLFCTGCLVSCNATIGDFNTFNDFVSIGHDTVIGNYNAFMTATRVSGIVTIGDCNFFGVNSCMVQGVKVGNNTIVAAGSALMRRTKDGYTYIGVPANVLIIKK